MFIPNLSRSRLVFSLIRQKKGAETISPNLTNRKIKNREALRVFHFKL